ncbi:unnamed protein product [Calypogeia fissa]
MPKMMQTAGDALRQAFMPKEEYESLRDEERAWKKLERPLVMSIVTCIWACVAIAFLVIIDIEFAVTNNEWPFCQKKRLESLRVKAEGPAPPGMGDSRASYLLTEEEAAQYFWIVVFLPTSIIFGVAVVYLLAGIAVAYTAPQRHPCLKVVENNCCASKRGGVRCLALLNMSFFAVFALLALFLGSSILTLQTDCSVALFWCYEVVCWGTAFLLAGSAIFLRRKAAVIMDVGSHYGSRTVGVELLEAPPVEPYHVIEERILEGFKSWSGGPDSDGEQEVSHEDHFDWEEDDEVFESYAAPVDVLTHTQRDENVK